MQARDERRALAVARLRAAFTGSMVAQADVLSLAAHLGGRDGPQVADQLVAAQRVDPVVFAACATELLQRAQVQQEQLQAEAEQLADRRHQAACVQLLAQRAAAMEMVSDALELAVSHTVQLMVRTVPISTAFD